MDKSIMLLDGFSIAFRAYYALPPLSAPDGSPVGAVLGFLNTLIKNYQDERPALVAAAFDLPVPSFRHSMYHAYKATRKPTPEDFKSQIPLIKEILRAMNIPIYEVAGYEADDILGTLAMKGENMGFAVSIISGDKDLLQTVTEKVSVKIPTGKDGAKAHFAADVKALYGVTPAQFIDVKALMGDSSDNIPGVPGIGEKTAISLISEFESLENCLANIGSVKQKKVRENLEKYRDEAIFSKKMVTIAVDVPVDFPAASETDGDSPQVFGGDAFAVVKRLGLKSLYKLFPATSDTTKSSETSAMYTSTIAPITSISSTDDSAIAQTALKFAALDEVAYVIMRDESREKSFAGICFASKEVGEYRIETPFGDLDEPRILGLCKAFFEGGAKKIAWDAKSDMRLLHGYEISLNNLEFDGMLAEYLLNMPYAKPSSAAELLDARNSHKTAIAEQDMTHLHEEIELPLIHILFDMENIGVGIDKASLDIYGDILGKRIDEITAKIYNLCGEEFNINSTQKLSAVLFDKMGLFPEGKPMKTGAYSTAADVLERLSHQHPVFAEILEYRKLTKLKSTYVDGLIQVMDANSARIHSTFNQNVTSTGRLSSSEPNLQNIPIRTALGRELRKAFVPADGCVFVDADYSQIELRVLAHMSDDETFISAFRDDLDIHRITAAEVFGVPLEDVSQEQRTVAKAVNFGIIYGQSAFGLANELKINPKQAEFYIKNYFARYPKVKSYLEETVKNAKNDGFAKTLTGRRRNIPEIQSKNRNISGFGERAAMNMPIQGTAADIIKIAMLRVTKRLLAEGFRTRLILQVHDELLFEAPKGEAEAVKGIIREEMEAALALKVPLKVDIGVGENWYYAK